MNQVNRMVASSVAAKNLATIGIKFSIALTFTALFVACGQNPQTRNVASIDTGIIGGTLSAGTEDYAKHTVILYDTSIGALCTASILSESILVTAAHCVSSEANALKVAFGTNMNSKDIVVRDVVAYETSPVWAFRQNQEFNTGDIALVRFTGGLPPGYSKINLLTDASKLTNDMDVMLAGYGASKVARVQDPKSGAMTSDHQEAGVLRSVTTTMKNATYSKSEFLVEASKGKSACHGDSGGPAYVTVDIEEGGRVRKETVLTGVTSRGVDDELDMCNVSAAYTSIPFYSAWIVSKSKQLNDLVVAPATTKVASH